VAYNGNERIAVEMGYSNHFVMMEIGRNETNPGQFIFKRKVDSGGGGNR
jgi:hypothetical protein